jgi:hypothetical protein
MNSNSKSSSSALNPAILFQYYSLSVLFLLRLVAGPTGLHLKNLFPVSVIILKVESF